MRTGRGGKVAVAAASGLLATCLAGGPLYISSTASEALQVGLSQSCLTDAGLRFGMAPLHDPDTGTITDQPEQVELDRLGALIPNTQPPIVTDETADVRFAAVGDANPASKRVILLSRVGQLANLDVDIGANDLSANTALVPEWDIPAFGADTTKRFEITIEPPPAFEPDGSGGSVTPATGEPRIVALDIVGSYPDIPTRPEPSFWCGQRDLFRLTRLGDRPTPVAFVSEQTIAALQPTRTWELRPDPNGLTRHDAREMIADFEQLRAAFIDFLGVSPEQAVQFGLFESRLPDLVRRADLQTEIVARTIAPIRLSGIGAAALMLIASGVLIARERRRDLRLRVMRGVSPGRVGASVVAGELAPVVIGSALGALVAFAAVRALGPTAELEPGPTRTAIVSVAAGALAATSLVAVITAIVTASTIDGRTRRRHRSIPWEFVLVPLAVVSYLRLDRVGGVKLVGAEAKGGDLLAQAFPILAITAPLAIAGRPLAALFRRARRFGRNLGPSTLIGLRRVTHEPAASAVLAISVALAVGAYMVSGSLTASAEQLLRDKTNTYLGGDMVVRTRAIDPLPAGLVGRATTIGLINANAGSRAVDLVGIDPATFADAVHWREDASERSLAELLGSIADPSGGTDGPLRAIVVGNIGDGAIVTKNRDALQIVTVATPDFFPGEHKGTELVVVDIRALQARHLALQPSIWLTDPPADTEQQLRDNGITILNIRESADVFEVGSFLTVRWSYAVLAAFGVLVGCVALFAQLLALDARRSTRQATWTLNKRMGMTMRGEAVALLTELGIPLVLGSAIGLTLGWLAVTIAVAPLDTISHLQPPARVIVDLDGVATALAVGGGALIVLTAIGLVSVGRAKPMEVMRGGN